MRARGAPSNCVASPAGLPMLAHFLCMAKPRANVKLLGLLDMLIEKTSVLTGRKGCLGQKNLKRKKLLKENGNLEGV